MSGYFQAKNVLFKSVKEIPLSQAAYFMAEEFSSRSTLPNFESAE